LNVSRRCRWGLAAASRRTWTAQPAPLPRDPAGRFRNTTISDDTGTASGPADTAWGGGIWNGWQGNLILTDSSVTHNTLTARAGISIQGGGLYTAVPVTLTNTKISSNAPGQLLRRQLLPETT
jgi:hypothetical protein